MTSLPGSSNRQQIDNTSTVTWQDALGITSTPMAVRNEMRYDPTTGQLIRVKTSDQTDAAAPYVKAPALLQVFEHHTSG